MFFMPQVAHKRAKTLRIHLLLIKYQLSNIMSSDYLEISYSNHLIDNEPDYCGILPFANSKLFSQSIIDYQKLTSGKDVKQVYELTIDLTDVDYNFYPGDAIGILAHNNEEEVRNLLEILGIFEESYCLSIMENTTKKKAVIPAHIPKNGSIERLFEEFLDIRSVPKKAFFKMLAHFTTNSQEKDELLALSAPKSEEYNDFITSTDAKSLLEILRKFPSCKPPLERLLEHLPALKPRFYSISSITNNKNAKNAIGITFSVVELETNTELRELHQKNCLKGVCTSYLENLLLNSQETAQNKPKIKFYFRNSTNFLHFSPEFNQPLILIGPGTGVAPFRGFLQAQSRNSNAINKIHLFFGCRYSDRDFLFKDELAQYVEKGVLTGLHVAFSRDGSEKIYVQDKLRDEGELIAQLLLNENACVRVCGDAKNLPIGVDEALRDVLGKFGGFDREECIEFIKELKRSGRYCLDVWI